MVNRAIDGFCHGCVMGMISGLVVLDRRSLVSRKDVDESSRSKFVVEDDLLILALVRVAVVLEQKMV